MEDKVQKIQESDSGIYGAQIASEVHQELKKLGGVKPPKEFVFMDRAAVGLGSVFMHLKAEVNWHRIFEDMIENFDIKKLTNNVGADLVVDCSGVSEGFTIALELIREGGMVLEVGIFSNSHDISINPHSHILEKSARVIGIGGDDISQYYPSIKLLDRTIHQLPWDKIISHNYNINNINKAMEVAMSDKSMKVLVNP